MRHSVKQLRDYHIVNNQTELGAYTGSQTAVQIAGNWFDYNAGSSATVDGVFVINATGKGSGRWLARRGRIFNASEWGLVGDYTTNNSSAINALLSFAQSGDTIYFPGGTYTFNSTVLLNKCINIKGSSSTNTILNFNCGTNWGINVAGAGLGGSATDGICIENVNLWGTAKALLRMYGTGLFRIKNITGQNSSNCLLYVDTCQDARISDVDSFAMGDGSGGKQGSVLYLVNSNNIYHDLYRAEAPSASAIYVDTSTDITFHWGKVDGNTAGSSTAAFAVADSSPVKFVDYHFDGAISYPTQLLGSGSLTFVRTAFNNSLAPAVVNASSINYTRLGAGYLPGSVVAPSVTFQDCTVVAEANNASTQVISSLIYSIAPTQIYSPNASTDIQTSGSFVRTSDSYVSIRYNNGSSYVTPGSNDIYVGAWLTHKQTGKKVSAWASFANGDAYINTTSLTDFPDGAFYDFEYAYTNGLQVNIDNLKVVYRTANNFTLFKQVVSLTVTASAWDSTNQRTNVSFSTGSITAGSLTGLYLVDSKGSTYLISGNSTTQVYLQYDQSATIGAGTYGVQAGHLYGDSLQFDGIKWTRLPIANKASVNTLTNASASGTVSWAWGSNLNTLLLTTAGNITVANPTGMVSGQQGKLVVVIGTAGHTLTFGSSYRFPTNVTPTFLTTAGAVMVFTMVYDGTRVNIAWDQPPGTSGGTVVNPVDYTLNGMLASTAPLITLQSSQKQGLTSATAYQALIQAVATGSVTKVYFGISIAGSSLTANSGSTVYNGIVIADTSGNVLAWANCATAFASTGVQTVSLSATVSLTAGTNYVVFLIATGTTAPQVYIPGLNNSLNVGISAFPFRAGQKSSTTLSNTGTLSITGYSASTVPCWIALGN